MKDALPVEMLAHRHCWNNMTPENVYFDCRKPAIPGRLLCARHAKQKNDRDRRRAKNKVARKARQEARR